MKWKTKAVKLHCRTQQEVIILTTINKLLGHTHTRLTALCPGLPGWATTRKVKPIWILLKQEAVSGSRISWAICKSASRSRQITTPTPHHSVFTGRVPFLPPNQQRQSTEGNNKLLGHWGSNRRNKKITITLLHSHRNTQQSQVRLKSVLFRVRISNSAFAIKLGSRNRPTWRHCRCG